MSQRTIWILLLAAVASGPTHAAGPSGWRTDGNGRYLDADPPLHWSPGRNVDWKTAMPSWSNASPVLLPDPALVFVCSEPDQILGVERSTGRIAWKNSVGDVPQSTGVKTHEANGYTTPTPITEGRRVFTVFGSGVAAAHTVDGERIWARFIEQPEQEWGHSASPALGSGRLIVHIVDLIGLDPATGKEVWREESAVKFGSPVVARIDGTDIVITPSGDVFRARDGKQLAASIGNLEYASPVVHNGVVYFIEKKAVAAQLPASFSEPFTISELWVARIQGSRHYASPVIHDGLVYTISREEKFTVLDAATGELVYEKDLDLGEGANSAYSSISLAADKLFVSAENGTTAVLQTGRTYRQIARNEVEGLRSSPVFEGDRMYLRAFDYLYCFVRPSPSP